MSIRDWPAAERPREKLLQQGATALSDAELLAIFLRTGVPGQSAVDLARNLLTQFGSLRLLLEADQHAFSKQLGLGPAKFAQLQAVLEMSRRHLAEQLRSDSVLESPVAVRDYLKALLRHEPESHWQQQLQQQPHQKEFFALKHLLLVFLNFINYYYLWAYFRIKIFNFFM